MGKSTDKLKNPAAKKSRILQGPVGTSTLGDDRIREAVHTVVTRDRAQSGHEARRAKRTATRRAS